MMRKNSVIQYEIKLKTSKTNYYTTDTDSKFRFYETDFFKCQQFEIRIIK